MVGKVTGDSDEKVTIETVRNGSRTVDTTGSTAYFEMFTRSSASSVKPGERVVVRLAKPARTGSAPASGSSAPTALAIEVIEPFTVGPVVSASSSLIVVSKPGGLERDIVVDKSTTYSKGGKSLGESAVRPGETIFAYGSVASDPTELDASHVVVLGSGSLRKMIGRKVAAALARLSLGAGPFAGFRWSGALALGPALLGS